MIPTHKFKKLRESTEGSIQRKTSWSNNEDQDQMERLKQPENKRPIFTGVAPRYLTAFATQL